MPIVAKSVVATDKDGKPVNLGGQERDFSGSTAFSLIPSDWYTAQIKSVKHEGYWQNVNGFPNPDTPDGKWWHIRIYPDFRLFNDTLSIISRQSFTVGATVGNGGSIDDVELIAPNPDNDVIWGGLRGARDFLTALRLFHKNEDGSFNLVFHPRAIRGMIVRVRTDIGGYRKGEFDIKPKDMLALLNEHSEVTLNTQAATFDADAIAAALKNLNEANNLNDENGYRLKNVITNVQEMWASKAEENGIYVAHREVAGADPVPTGQFFVNEAAYEAYVEAMYAADLPTSF